MAYGCRYVIIFDGEIYNYRELREQLSQEGYAFASKNRYRSILAAYHRWGASGINQRHLLETYSIAKWEAAYPVQCVGRRRRSRERRRAGQPISMMK